MELVADIAVKFRAFFITFGSLSESHVWPLTSQDNSEADQTAAAVVFGAVQKLGIKDGVLLNINRNGVKLFLALRPKGENPLV